MRVSAVLTPLTPRLEDEEQAGAIQIVLDTKQGWVFIREVFEVNDVVQFCSMNGS